MTTEDPVLETPVSSDALPVLPLRDSQSTAEVVAGLEEERL